MTKSEYILRGVLAVSAPVLFVIAGGVANHLHPVGYVPTAMAVGVAAWRNFIDRSPALYQNAKTSTLAQSLQLLAQTFDALGIKVPPDALAKINAAASVKSPRIDAPVSPAVQEIVEKAQTADFAPRQPKPVPPPFPPAETPKPAAPVQPSPVQASRPAVRLNSAELDAVAARVLQMQSSQAEPNE